MSQTDEERLVILLEARIKDLERNMAKASGTTEREFRKMSQSSKSATKQMEQDAIRSTTRINQAMATVGTRIGAVGKAFAGGLVAGAAVGALAGIQHAAVESTKAILEMSDQAKMAGVSFKAFQQLKFVAQQNRVGVDALTDGLKELNLRADEFVVTGKGSAAEAFQRLGYSAEDLRDKLKEPDQLFLEIIGKLERLDKAAQIRIADELFGGTGGEKFVQLISQGERGLRQQIKAAEDLGIVMDESMIKRAEEVNRKFDMITTTIGTHLKSAIVNAVSAWFEFLDSYNEFKDQQKGTLETRQKQLGLRRLDVENQLLQTPATEEMPRRKLQAQLDEIAREEAIVVNELNSRLNRTRDALPPEKQITGSGLPVSTGPIDLTKYLAAGKDASHVTGMSSGFESKLEKMMEALPKELAGQITINSGFRSNERQAQLWQEALTKYGSVAEARKWVAPPGNSQHNKGNAADIGYGSDNARKWAHENASRFGLSFPRSNENWHVEDQDARSGAMTERTKELEERGQAYDDLKERARQFVADQGLESQALNMTTEAAARLRYEQDLLNEAKQAGISLNPTQLSDLKALAAEMASAEERTRSLAKSQQDLQEASEEFGAQAKSVVGGFINDLRRGVDSSEALRNALARIGDMALDGLLSQLFGGGGVKGGGLFGNLFQSIFGGLGKNADGTEFWKGGPTWVGERGPEIINAPRGSRIVPNHHIGKQQQQKSQPQNNNLNVSIIGASGDPHVRMLVQQGVAEALAAKNEQDRRVGFGAMQARYSSQKG